MAQLTTYLSHHLNPYRVVGSRLGERIKVQYRLSEVGGKQKFVSNILSVLHPIQTKALCDVSLVLLTILVVQISTSAITASPCG